MGKSSHNAIIGGLYLESRDTFEFLGTEVCYSVGLIPINQTYLPLHLK